MVGLEGRNKLENFDRNVFSLLSKKGSFQILASASKGLKAETGKWKEFDLSKRQYYSRIRSLKSLELIKKERESYKLTETGEKFLRVLSLADNTSTSPDLNKKEKKMDISREDALKEDPLAYFRKTDEREIEVSEIFSNYEGMVDRIIDYINNAESELYIASKYTDHRVLKALLEVDGDVKLKALGSNSGVKSALERLKAVSGPFKFKRLLSFAKNNARRYSGLPYSFALKDHGQIGLEIPNPLQSSQFFLAFTLRSRKLYKILKKLFERIYQFSSGGFSLIEKDNSDKR